MASSMSSAVSDTYENLKRIFDVFKDDKNSPSRLVLEPVEDKDDTDTKCEKSAKPNVSRAEDIFQNLRSPVCQLVVEVTKLSLLFSKKPPPPDSEARCILEEITALVEKIVHTCCQLPKSQGRWLSDRLILWVLRLKSSLVDFLVCSHSEQSQVLASYLFDVCEDVTKLPANNLEAVKEVLVNEENMVTDALQEIQDEVKADRVAQIQDREIDNSSTWTNQDRELLPSCIGLVETARSTMGKIRKVIATRGNCDTVENIAHLDAIADKVKLISPAIDKLANVVYPPMVRNTVRSAALKVVTVIKQILEMYQKSPFFLEADNAWLSSLLRAVDHRNNKVQPLLNPY